MSNEVVLGIDVGYAITGWAVLKKDTILANKNILIDFGAVTTSTDLEHPKRLEYLYSSLITIINEYKVNTLAVEDIFFFKNQKTIVKVSQARGVILLAGSTSNLAIFNYTPLQVKTAVTGYGRADKKQVQKMVKLIYKLNTIPKPDDIADAIAIGTCHLNTNRLSKIS